MKYLVEARASMERGNEIDQKGGPGPLFDHIAKRFKPEAFYGNPSRRQVFLIVDLATEAQIGELMYVLTWFTGTEPTFTPLTAPKTFAQCIENATKAPPIGRPWA